MAEIDVSFNHRAFTTDQLLDASGRIVQILLHPERGLPAEDGTTREIVGDAATGVQNLQARLRVERKGLLTDERAQHQKRRDEAMAAIRRGVKAILSDPDPNLPKAKRAGAAVLRNLLAKRPNGFEKKSHAENSAQLQLLFADLETAEAQGALAATDLLRLFQLLKEAQARFAALVQDEGQVVMPAQTLPNLRTIRQKLNGDVRLALQLVSYFAAKGRQPYAGLLAPCQAVLAEIGAVAKVRGTRAAKAQQTRDTGMPA